MLLVYTPQVTNRVRYTFDLFLKELLGLVFQLTADQEVFQQHNGPKFSYGVSDASADLSFVAHPLLFERGIKDQNVSCASFDGLKIFFPIQDESSPLPFDPFAAGFYLVSRYEEYLPFDKDQHGRFPSEKSLAFRNGFLSIPLVNHYAIRVKKVLSEKLSGLTFHEKPYQFTPTYDIDSAYAYLNKGVIRNIGGFARSIYQGNLGELKERVQVLSHNRKDPFDSYDWLNEIHAEYKLNPVYFFLVGDYDEYDKNISINITEYQNLIKATADNAAVGIHPSYASNEDESKLPNEIKRMTDILRQDIRKSRQHFLRLEMPDTYERLLENDILEDYTMGFASQPGFRASICSPFYFYNLREETKTPLRIFPFTLMDATLQYYLNKSPNESMAIIAPLIEAAKAVNGHFISLWHNNTFSEDAEGKAWRNVYKEMIQLAIK